MLRKRFLALILTAAMLLTGNIGYAYDAAYVTEETVVAEADVVSDTAADDTTSAPGNGQGSDKKNITGEFPSGNITWTLTNAGMLTLSGEGDMDSFDADSTPWAEYDTKIKFIYISEGITSIGDYVFYGLGDVKTVYIPDSVTAIGASAFEKCDKLQEISLPDGLTTIGDSAFRYCSRIKSIEIPDSVVSIGKTAFSNCEKLRDIYVSSDNSSYCDVDGVLFTAGAKELVCYPDGKNDKEYKVPDSVTAIGAYAFDDCDMLTFVILPEGLISIGDSAFYGCSQIETFAIPASVTEIAHGAFNYGCDSLKEINVDEANSVYSSEYGVLFNKDKTKLIRYPALNDSACYYGEYDMPNSVKIIGAEAFMDCQTVELVRIYGGLKKIEIAAFMNFESLYRIRFRGTIYNWEMVEKDILNDKLDEISVVCMEGELEKEFQAKVGVTYYLKDFVDIKENEAVLESLVVSSSNPEVATVDNEKMTAISEGEAIITAVVIDEGTTYAAAVKVIVTQDGGESNSGSFDLIKGETMDLTKALSVPDEFLESLVWNSSNKNIVTVDNGLVSAVDEGTAVVIATLNKEGSLKYNIRCTINVAPKYTEEKYFLTDGGTILDYRGPYAEVDIPPTIGGVTITKIGSNSFRDKKVTKVEMPDTVTMIEDFAFYGCDSLSNITLHKGITFIGDYAFGDCDSLIKMTIPATVANEGSYWFSGSEKLSTVTFAAGTKTIGKGIRGSSIKSVVIPSTVTQISSYAFRDCTSLASVKIPDSVTKVGAYAFADCYALKNVTIGKNVTLIDSNTFVNCKKLQNVTLGSGVTKIGSSAFKKCSSLSQITIPDNVATINSYAFTECEKLNNVVFGSGLTSIGSYAFSYCDSLGNVSLPQALTTIGQYAFYCSGLKSVTIPDSVTSAGIYAFSGCDNLSDVVIGSGLGIISMGMFSSTAIKSIDMPANVYAIDIGAFKNCYDLADVTLNNVRSIGNRAFYYCNNLNNIVLPDSLKSIDGYAFAYTGISSIVIPNNVTSVGESLFYGCSSLIDVTIGSSLENISQSMFNGCNSIRKVTLAEGVKHIDDYAFSGCFALTDVIMPDTVISIGKSAFYNCSELRNVKLSNNLVEIGTCAFLACRKLENIELPDTVTTIGSYAFSNCNKLKSIDIPDSVTSIGSRAFAYCYDLEQVKLSNNLKTISDETFYMCTSLKEIVIPDSVLRVNYYAFAYCSELSSVTLGANISYFGYSVFYGCNKLSFTGGIPAAVAKYILSNNLFETGDLNIIHNYFNSGNTSYAPRNDAMVGYFEMELKYEFKDGIYPSKKTLKVNLPQNAYLLPGTMMIDGELLGEGAYKEFENAQYNYNYIEIPVENNKGVLTFCIKPTEYTTITTYAEMIMKINGRSVTEFVGYANCSLPEVTISAPDVVGKPEFIVEGITLPNCQVSIHVSGNDFSTHTKSSRTGSYKTSLKIDNPENYKEYKISVSVLYRFNDQIDGTKSYYTDTTVQYVSNTPSLEGLDMYYGKNGYTKTEYDLFNAASRPKIRWGDYLTGRGRGYSYYFAVDVANRENVDNVYVVSTRNNKKSYLEAVWNEYTQRYETSGYFDNNCEYIPGVLTVEYVKGDAQIRLGLSDIATYLDYESDAFAPSVTEYTPTTYSAVVAVGEALQEIFGSEIDFAVETVDRDYTEVTDEELYEDKFNYYAYPYENENGRYVLAFDMSDISKTAVYLHDITNAKQTTYTMSFVYYDEEGMANYIDVAEILSRINEYAGKLLNVYDINIDTNKLVDDLMISDLAQEDIDTGLAIADSLNIKKQMFVLISTVLSASSIDGISAPADVIDCILGAISKDVSFFRQHRLMSVFRIGSESKIRWMIDPSGYVYEAVTDNRLEGVTATAYCIEESKIPADAEGNKDFENINPEDVVLWDASEYENQVNPIITDAAGEYKWDVPDGYYWQVKYEKEGYETTYSEWLPVPPVQTDVNIGLVSKAAPKVENVNLTTDYMVLTFDKYIKPETLADVKIGDAAYTMEYDKTKADLDGNVFAKEFTFKFTETLPTGEPYTISVDGAKSYADVAMEAFSAEYTTPGEPLPKELMLTSATADVNTKSISLSYHNNTTTDMTVNIVCVIYDANGDIAQVEMLGSEGIKVGEKIDRVFGFDSTWAQYKIYTWHSSSLKPAVALYDSAVAQ